MLFAPLNAVHLFGRAEAPVLIAAGSAISTQHLPTNVLPRAGLQHQIEQTGTNGVFGIWKSGFMNIFKIGRNYSLFGWQQASELTSLAKQVLQVAFQPCQKFAQTALYEHLLTIPSAAELEWPAIGQSSAGMRRKFDLPLDRPLNP